MENRRKTKWVGLAVVFAVTVLVVLTIAGVFFGLSWSEFTPATQSEARDAFDTVLAEEALGPPYIEINEEGHVLINRDLELESPVPFEALLILAWDSERSFLLRAEYPYWFVRLKLSDAINLGTLLAVLAGDWASIDLRVTEEDLERRGPGLILDHTLTDGSRIIMWTK